MSITSVRGKAKGSMEEDMEKDIENNVVVALYARDDGLYDDVSTHMIKIVAEFARIDLHRRFTWRTYEGYFYFYFEHAHVAEAPITSTAKKKMLSKLFQRGYMMVGC